jgi:hypothetical protein
MSKRPVFLLICAVVVLGTIAPVPLSSMEPVCADCYEFELPLPDGTTRPCLACLQLPASTSTGCYQVGVCGCVAFFPFQCHSEGC